MEDILWIPVIGYEDYYEVSNKGVVKSMPRVISCTMRARGFEKNGIILNNKLHRKGRELAQSDLDGYKRVKLTVDGQMKAFLIHRLVFCSFNRISLKFTNHLDKCLILHKDDNRANNRLDNLFQGTQMDNVHDMIKKNRQVKTVVNFQLMKNSRLTINQVLDLRNRAKLGERNKDLADSFGINRGKVTRIIKGELYKIR